MLKYSQSNLKVIQSVILYNKLFNPFPNKGVSLWVIFPVSGPFPINRVIVTKMVLMIDVRSTL